MRHTPAQLIASIDRHGPRNWRLSAFPEPRILFLPEIESFALSSTAFSQGHLWNEAWSDPEVGFPIKTAHAVVRAFLLGNQDKAQGVIHFGSSFAAEIGRMMQIQEIPSYLTEIVSQIRRGADDVFQDAELFWSDNAVRMRFVTE